MSNQNPAAHESSHPAESFAAMGVDLQTGDDVGYMGTNEPLPAGWYMGMVTHSEFKDTKDGTGKRLNLTWEVTEGDNKGRKIFTGLNLVNKSQQAVDISRKELNTIYAAMGYPQGHRAQGPSELHDRPIWVQVKVVPGNAEYPSPKNEVNGYHPWTPTDPTTGGPIRAKPQSPVPGAPGPVPAAQRATATTIAAPVAASQGQTAPGAFGAGSSAAKTPW